MIKLSKTKSAVFICLMFPGFPRVFFFRIYILFLTGTVAATEQEDFVVTVEYAIDVFFI